MEVVQVDETAVLPRSDGCEASVQDQEKQQTLEEDSRADHLGLGVRIGPSGPKAGIVVMWVVASSPCFGFLTQMRN